jgi:YVTN family beta-propeller protein
MEMRYAVIFVLIGTFLAITSCEPPHDNPLDPENPETEVQAPQNVKGLTVESEPGRVILKWDEDESASKYRIYRKGPDDAEFTRIGETAETEYVDEGVKPGKRYQYKIVALYRVPGASDPLEGSIKGAIPRNVDALGEIVDLRIIAPETLKAGEEGRLKAEVRYDGSDRWWDAPDPKWSLKGEGTVTKDGLLRSEKSGVIEVTAECGGLSRTLPVRITPGKPRIFEVSGPSEGHTGEKLSQPFKVAVRDRFGNPIEGVPVRFKLSVKPQDAGTVSLSPEEMKTGPLGYAESWITLGTKPGDYTVRAELADDPAEIVDLKIKAIPYPERIVITDPGGNPPKVDPGERVQVRVRVTDKYDNPVPDVKVSLTPSEVGAEFDPSEPITDRGGIAISTLTVWRKKGLYRVIAVCKGVRGEREIEVVEGKPYRIEREPHTESAQISWSVELRVRVTDKEGNPAGGVKVEFKIISTPKEAGASLSRDRVETDESGIASVQLTLGLKVGRYVVRAENPDLNGSPVDFVVQATHGPPAKLEKLSGDSQKGVATEQLQDPFVVRVTDIGGNPVPGVKVRFELAQSPKGSTGWQFSDDIPSTGTDGEARVWFTPGERMGDYVISASASRSDGTPLQGSPVSFTCYADHTEPQIISGISGYDQTGTVGGPLAKPFVVRITDRYNNPVDDVEIAFEIVKAPSNDARVTSPVRTDEFGLAKSTLTLGTKIGEYEVHALFGSLKVPFHARATSDKPEKVISVSGEDQSGNPGELLDEPLIVQVLDRYGNPCPGVKVGFSVTESPGGASGMTLSPQTVETDGKGYARTEFTLGDKVGEYRITAKLIDYPEKLVTFTAKAWECRLRVSPEKLDFGYGKSKLTLTIVREGCAETLRFEVTSDDPWLTPRPESGLLSSDSPFTITLSVERDGLKPGVHETVLKIRFDGKGVAVPVTMEVRRNLIVRSLNARYGDPVPDAEVAVDGRKAVTDGSGEAVIEDFKGSGRVTISASREGYIPATKEVEVPEVGDFTVELPLKPLPKPLREISSTAPFPFTVPRFIALSPDGSRAYVTNNEGGTVSVMDATSDKVIKDVKVRGWPEEVVVNPVLDEAYVACNEDDCVYVINTEMNGFGGIINVGNGPTGVDVSDDGGWLFVTNMLEGSVSVVDTATRQERVRIPVGKEPNSVASYRSRLYVSNQRDGTVSVIDLSTEREVDVIKVGSKPWGIAVSPSGKFIYVVNYRGGTVSMIDISNDEVVKSFDVGRLPVDVAVDGSYPEGDLLYVTISSSGSVTVVDTATGIVLKEAIRVGEFPHGIAIDGKSGKIYVVNSASETVSVLGF